MVEQNELPIVAMNMVFKTGSANEPADRVGLANFTSRMLVEGTTKRSAEEISNALQSIGASLNTGASFDSMSISLQTLTRNLDAALEIYSDVIVNPSFPEKELGSLRSRAIIGLRQQRANPNAISDVVFNKVLYGDHPYGRESTEAALRAIAREDVVRFYESNFRPNNAVLIVVGSYDKGKLKPALEKSFAGWKSGNIAKNDLPPLGKFEKPGIYIVDRPGAAQSVVAIGQVGVSRDNPDFVAIQVMNSILGGGITSRISMNLREEKGYTYGANSGWAFRRGPGPFRAGGDIQTAVTKEAVIEFMKELNGIRGARPVTREELEYNKQSIIRRFPAGFETVGAIASQLANLFVYDLPDNYFNEFIAKVNAVTIEDVDRVARRYLDPDKMAIVIVGDRKLIEPGLKQIDKWGKAVYYLDSEGNPVQ
ncbi:MAG: hypothetical protein C4325_03415 [Blastocatellia bacterium]